MKSKFFIIISVLTIFLSIQTKVCATTSGKLSEKEINGIVNILINILIPEDRLIKHIETIEILIEESERGKYGCFDYPGQEIYCVDGIIRRTLAEKYLREVSDEFLKEFPKAILYPLKWYFSFYLPDEVKDILDILDKLSYAVSAEERLRKLGENNIKVGYFESTEGVKVVLIFKVKEHNVLLQKQKGQVVVIFKSQKPISSKVYDTIPPFIIVLSAQIELDCLFPFCGGKLFISEQSKPSIVARLGSWSEIVGTQEGSEPSKPPPIHVLPGTITFVINGRVFNPNTMLIIENGTLLIPVRFVAEALGAKIKEDISTHTITIHRGSSIFKMVEGKKFAYELKGINYIPQNPDAWILYRQDINTLRGRYQNNFSLDNEPYDVVREIPLDIPPKLSGGDIMVSLDFFKDTFGVEVNWDKGKNTVIIKDASPVKEVELVKDRIYLPRISGLKDSSLEALINKEFETIACYKTGEFTESKVRTLNEIPSKLTPGEKEGFKGITFGWLYKEGILSVWFRFTGYGAHPGDDYVGYNVDIKTGRRLRLKDFFVEDNWQELVKRAMIKQIKTCPNCYFPEDIEKIKELDLISGDIYKPQYLFGSFFGVFPDFVWWVNKDGKTITIYYGSVAPEVGSNMRFFQIPFTKPLEKVIGTGGKVDGIWPPR